MHLLIDGHNLIPQLPGLSLQDPDDEFKLTRWLLEYCRRNRSKATIFFDQAPVGRSGMKNIGLVTVVNVPQIRSADDAIIDFLHKLGKTARNYTVVSSDRQIEAAARSYHAKVTSSKAFAAIVLKTLDFIEKDDPREHILSDDELEEWHDLFTNNSGNNG